MLFGRSSLASICGLSLCVWLALSSPSYADEFFSGCSSVPFDGTVTNDSTPGVGTISLTVVPIVSDSCPYPVEVHLKSVGVFPAFANLIVKTVFLGFWGLILNLVYSILPKTIWR